MLPLAVIARFYSRLLLVEVFGPAVQHIGLDVSAAQSYRIEMEGVSIGGGGGVAEFPLRAIPQHGSMHAWGATMLNGRSEATYIWIRVLKMGTRWQK